MRSNNCYYTVLKKSWLCLEPTYLCRSPTSRRTWLSPDCCSSSSPCLSAAARAEPAAPSAPSAGGPSASLHAHPAPAASATTRETEEPVWAADQFLRHVHRKQRQVDNNVRFSFKLTSTPWLALNCVFYVNAFLMFITWDSFYLQLYAACLFLSGNHFALCFKSSSCTKLLSLLHCPKCCDLHQRSVRHAASTFMWSWARLSKLSVVFLMESDERGTCFLSCSRQCLSWARLYDGMQQLMRLICAYARAGCHNCDEPSYCDTTRFTCSFPAHCELTCSYRKKRRDISVWKHMTWQCNWKLSNDSVRCWCLKMVFYQNWKSDSTTTPSCQLSVM